MPQPNVNVVIALLEVYLTQRMAYWGPNPPAIKTDVCADLLQTLLPLNEKKAKVWKTNEWIAFAFKLYENEDRARKSDTDGFFKNIAHSLNPLATNLLADTLLACRSYVIECLAEEETFKNKYTALQKRHFDAKTKVLVADKDNYDKPTEKTRLALKEAQDETLKVFHNLESLTDEKKYIHAFYAANISKLDVKHKELNTVKADAELKPEDKTQEKSWAEFVKNVENNLRPPVLCKKLLTDKNKVIDISHSNHVELASINQPTAHVEKAEAAAPKQQEKVEPANVAAETKDAEPPKMLATTSALRANSLMKDTSPKKTSTRKPRKPKTAEHGDELLAPNDNHNRPVTRLASRRAGKGAE